REELVARGHRRLEDFSREHVRERLREALALGGYELPEERKKNVVILSSDQRCGIHHYSLAVCDGLRKRGHHVTFVGVRHLDTADLQKKLRYIRDDVDTILIEHEAGIFRDVPFVDALFRLRRRGFPIGLSTHELEPEKRRLRERLGLPQDKFIFVSPGFFFARKRYIEVSRALPEGSVLVLSGTRSDWEPRYFDEVMAAAKERADVIVNTDYDTMGDFV